MSVEDELNLLTKDQLVTNCIRLKSMLDAEVKMTRALMEKQINPPLVVSDYPVALSPPFKSVADYMAYLYEHRDDYARFFGYPSWAEMELSQDQDGR